eukprot:c726_g1_i1.p1 GENE.c726_g1_i1~~c726_g1_i1.p1  ORF type:complete len:222 (+),score=6.60 c726_g1_i1:193-858(+)
MGFFSGAVGEALGAREFSLCHVNQKLHFAETRKMKARKSPKKVCCLLWLELGLGVVQGRNNVRFDAVGRCCWGISLNGDTINTQELGKVPFYVVGRNSWEEILKKLEQRMCIWPIHIDFFEHGESGAVLGEHISFHLCGGLGLLTPKLVARKCQDLKPARVKPLVYILQLRVIFLGQASFRGHVHNKGDFSHDITDSHLLAANFLDHKVLNISQCVHFISC